MTLTHSDALMMAESVIEAAVRRVMPLAGMWNGITEPARRDAIIAAAGACQRFLRQMAEEEQGIAPARTSGKRTRVK